MYIVHNHSLYRTHLHASTAAVSATSSYAVQSLVIIEFVVHGSQHDVLVARHIL